MTQAVFSEFVARTDGRVESLSDGAMPPDARTMLPDLLGKRPTVRKMGDGLVCTAPAGPDWYVRTYANRPADSTVADVLRDVQSVAQQRAQPVAQPSNSLLSALEGVSKILRKNRIRFVMKALVGHGFASAAILAPLRNGKVKRLHYSDHTHRNAKDDIRLLLRSCLEDDATTRFDFAADDHSEAKINGALLCEKLDGRTITIHLPDDRKEGFAVLAVNADPTSGHAMADAPAALELALPRRKVLALRLPKMGHLMATIAAVAAAVWLMSPADIRVSNQARAIPSETIAVTVPFGAYIEAANVDPGASVTAGQELASLKSPELENRKAEEQLTQRLEEISAAEALSAGDYGAFQLAEKRGEIASLREQFLDESIAQLRVIAPEDGVVVDAISGADRGRFLQPGETLYSLQPTSKFDVLIDVEPADAPLIEKNQTGFIFFRGLGNVSYPLRIVEPPKRVTDQTTGASRLQVRAQVKSDEQDQLLVGLTGFAKINVDQGPRVEGMTRPAVEYVRLKLWTFFGFHI